MNNETLWALTDRQGSVTDVVDSSAKERLHRVFDGFGNVTSETHYNASGTAVASGTGYLDEAFAYTGRFYDKATGLQNNLNRWYDPTIGRWISEDPIGFAAGDTNLYRYVGNSPTNYIDPKGLGWLPPWYQPPNPWPDGGYPVEPPPSPIPWQLPPGTFPDPGDGGIRAGLPFFGPPNTSDHMEGPGGQIRDYGPCGIPKTDYDFGHPEHHPGIGSPHAHDWGIRDGEWVRGPARPIGPNEVAPAAECVGVGVGIGVVLGEIAEYGWPLLFAF